MDKKITNLLWQIEIAEHELDVDRVSRLRRQLSDERRRFAEIRQRKVAQRRQGEHIIRVWRSET